jgi:hypothetical protein
MYLCPTVDEYSLFEYVRCEFQIRCKHSAQSYKPGYMFQGDLEVCYIIFEEYTEKDCSQ